jgi:hypothetical protein
LDSNFLLIPFQFGVDIFEELNRILDVKYKVFTLKKVIKELEGLSKQKGVKAKQAHAALEEAKKLPLIDGNEDVDEAMLKLASKDTIICTNDKVLKEKIRKKGAPVIYLRQKKYLTLEGYII